MERTEIPNIVIAGISEALGSYYYSHTKACAAYQKASGSMSTERRFISLLDADSDQLPHRLRQMIALLKEQAIDFGSLLKGLLYWSDDQKHTQNAWARDFYRNLNYETATEHHTDKEINE
jgi:CRISPR system Cascade subunit CasB